MKKNKKVIIIIIVSLVILILCIGGFVLFKTTHSINNSSNNTSNKEKIKDKKTKKDKDDKKSEDTKTDNENNSEIEKIIKDNNLEELRDLIYKNEDLFIKYSNVVESNENLGEGKKYIYDCFKVVADQKKYLDEERFFNRLSTLSFNYKLDETYVSKFGDYNEHTNELNVYNGGNTNHIIYHELMHFIDKNLNDNYPDAAYNYEGKYISKEKYDKLSSSEKEKVDIVLGYVNFDEYGKDYSCFLTEAGAELYNSRYFNHSYTMTYKDAINLYYLFEYLFGTDKMEGVFFGNVSFYALTKGYFAENDFINFLNTLYIITYSKDATNVDYRYAFDSIINLYNYTHDDEWYNDKEFCLLLYNYINEHAEWFSDSLYKNTYNDIYVEYNNLYQEYSNHFDKYVGTDSYVYPRIIYEDNKTYLFTFINIETENETLVKFIYDKNGNLKEVYREKFSRS